MNIKFAIRLKELREEKGLSHAKLAKELGNKVTKSGIAHWEVGNRIPNLVACIILADYFKVSLDFLAGREE